MPIQVHLFFFFLMLAGNAFLELGEGEVKSRKQMPFDWRPFTVDWFVGGEHPPLSSEKETNRASYMKSRLIKNALTGAEKIETFNSASPQRKKVKR